MKVLDLGIAPYTQVQELQKRLRLAVLEERLDGTLLMLEHPPVITLGKHASTDDIVDLLGATRRGLQIVRSERGGQSTLHAPGQLVAYPVVPVPRRNLRAYVQDLEEVVVRLLAKYHLTGARVDGRPGVYVKKRKIASVGLRCQNGVTSHGTALNVSLDLTLFDLITSCGDPLLKQTSVESETGLAYPMSETKSAYTEAFAEVFGLALVTTAKVPWENVEGFLGLRA